MSFAWDYFLDIFAHIEKQEIIFFVFSPTTNTTPTTKKTKLRENAAIILFWK